MNEVIGFAYKNEADKLVWRLVGIRREYNSPHSKEVDEVANALREAKLAGIRIGLEAAVHQCEHWTPKQDREWHQSDDGIDIHLAKWIGQIDPTSLMEEK